VAGLNHCQNGEIDQGESDIDCGGSCDKCSDGSKCRTANDCDSAICRASKCEADSDNDGVIDSVDKCQSTASRASVNSDGCSASQISSIDSNSDGLPDSWMMSNFGSVSCNDLQYCGANADPDKDGLSNLQEYNMKLDPQKKDNPNVQQGGGSGMVTMLALIFLLLLVVVVLLMMRKKPEQPPKSQPQQPLQTQPFRPMPQQPMQPRQPVLIRPRDRNSTFDSFSENSPVAKPAPEQKPGIEQVPDNEQMTGLHPEDLDRIDSMRRGMVKVIDEEREIRKDLHRKYAKKGK